MSSALQPAAISGSNLTDLEKANLHLQLLRQEYLKLQEKLAETQKKINLLVTNADAEAKASFPSKLVAIVRNLFDRSKYSDVTIKIGGGVELRGHKFVLAARSEIWSSLLDEDDANAGSSKMCPDVVDLSHLPHEVGYAVMRWVYCDEINFAANSEPGQDENFVLGVMAAAGSLRLKQLMNRCEERLIACVNVRSCISFFTAAHDIGADRLKNHCSELISSHWSDFTEEDFKDMNAQLLHGMLKQRTTHPLHSAIVLHRDDVVFLHLIENDSPAKVDQPDSNGNVPLMLALSTRQEGLAKTLVEHKANVNARDDRGYSLLHQAIMNGDAACARFLLEHGADPLATTLKEGSTSLHLIAGIVPPKRASVEGGIDQLPSIVGKLLERGADPNSSDNVGRCRYTEFPPLAGATEGKRSHDLLGIHSIPIVVADRTPLHVAIDNGNHQVVEEMLKGRFGVNLEKRNHDGNSPLWLAIRVNSGEVDETADGGRIIRKLVELGASVNAVHPTSKDSILHLCARAGYTAACLFLLDCGASANVTNSKGEAVLHVAAKRGMVTLIQRILRVGGNPNLQTFEADEDESSRNESQPVTQETPLHVAVRCRQTEAIASLLQLGMASAIGVDLELRDSNGRTVLGSALKRGDLQTAKTLVQYGAKVNVRGPVPGGGYKTLLEQALEARDEAAILFLIDQGVQLDDGELSKSPLLMAVEQNLCKVVEALCNNGAALGDYSEPDQSPLWIALDKQFWDVASVLVRNGFDVEGWNIGPEGCHQTLLHKAIDENKEEAAAFLIRSGCNVDALRKLGPDGRGGEEARDKATPLHLACQWGQELVAETLLEFGADVNVQDVDGQTPLHVGIVNRHDGLVNLLLSHPKLDLRVLDKLGRTPLHTAMVNRNNKAATGIVERNPAAVNLHDSKGKTFLHSAVIRGDLEGVLFLLSLHVDIDTMTKDSEGCTALHLAVRSSGNSSTSTPEAKESVIRHLLLAGADPNAQTLRRLTPLHLAACEGSADIAQILLSSGASPCAVDDEHNTPLHTAMKNSRFSAIKVLMMDDRTDMLAVNLRGYNCLHILCKFGTDNAAAILEWMLEKFPDFPINKQDAEGNTGMLLAYMRGHAALCKALVKAAACLGVPNKLGVTIFNYQLATKTLLHRLLDCVTKEPPWAEADVCLECGTKFSLTTRKHHCRHCGRVLCSKCSNEETPIVKFGCNKPARVCNICYKVITLGIGATSIN